MEKVELVPLTKDYAFKKLFTSNLEMLKKFILDVLHFDVNPKEVKMTLLDDTLPKENDKEYQKTVDIYVQINDNIYVDIEMNRNTYNAVRLRNELYLSKIKTLLLEKGDTIKKLKDIKIYQLNLNAAEKTEVFAEDIIVPYGIKSGSIYDTNAITVLKYLEFYKNKYYNGSKEKEVVWLAALTSETIEQLEEIMKNILPKKQLEKFMKDVISMSKDHFVLHEWEKEKLDELVRENVKEENIKEGIAKGKIEGKKEGKIEGKIEKSNEIARNMLKENLNIDLISKVTGLTVEAIEKLK